MKHIIYLFVFLLFFSRASAQLYETESGHAEVHGKSTATNYTGVSDELSGKINFETGEVFFRLRLESLHTGNSKRDKHMKETLNTNAYPYAEFHGKIVSEFDIEKLAAEEVNVKGTFNIHGQSKEIEVTAHLDPNRHIVNFSTSFPVLLSEYGMERPKVLVVKTDDKHTVQVSGELKEVDMNARK